MKNPPSATPRSAFTLIELLVVILIIGILAAIMIPVVGNIRSSAQKSNCTSNLRHLYAASILYTNTNGGQIMPAQDRRTNLSAYQWPALILDFMEYPSIDDMKRDIACPSYEGNQNGTFWALGYAYNETPIYLGDSSGLSNSKSYGQLYRINENGGGPRYRLSQLTKSSNRLMFCDSDSWHINPSVTEAHADLSRHGTNQCNAVFYDGHVAMLTPDEVHFAVADPSLFGTARAEGE